MNNENKEQYKKLYEQGHVPHSEGLQWATVGGKRRLEAVIEYMRREKVEEEAVADADAATCSPKAEEFYNAK